MHLLLIFLALLTQAPATPPAQGPAIEELAWMAGCWRQESSNRVVDEIWMAPSGGAMLGISRTVAGGRAVAHEFMQIRAQAGAIAFISRPSGQPEASFTLIKSGAGEAVFENRAHDFPQRVIYRLQGETLLGRIEGIEKGKERSADFPMRRAACPK